jgi:GTP pyrophosphokinase
MPDETNAPAAPGGDHLDQFWADNPQDIRRFQSQESAYGHLADEVDYILSKRLRERGVKVSGVTRRVKTLASFLGKAARKHYDDPFEEVTDFAGVRVVYLYPSDLTTVDEIIHSEFEVVEKEDKAEAMLPDQFGYGGVHYIVKLGSKSSGARYDDLQTYKCEIQVRSAFQDVWATYSHSLLYKNESNVPEEIVKDIHALAGSLHVAETGIQTLRDKQEQYRKDIAESGIRGDFLATPVNVDSVQEYLRWKFKDADGEPDRNAVADVCASYLEGYKTLSDVDRVVEAYRRQVMRIFESDGEVVKIVENRPLVALAMSCHLEEMAK